MNGCNLIKLFFLFQMTVIVFSKTFVSDSTAEFSLLFSGELRNSELKVLERNKWIKLYQITPRAYTFKYNGTLGNLNNSLDQVRIQLKTIRIVEIEKVKNYVSVFDPIETESEDEDDSSDVIEDLNKYNLVCDKYYGMGIEDAWSLGYSGKGVKVAVTDIGINTDLEDLRENIDNELCVNLINESASVEPERLHSYQDAAFFDHGNRCASVIAAEKGNDICSAGIAFNATIVAVKMFSVVNKGFPRIGVSTTSSLRARSQVYELDKIDIYSNSWGPTKPFTDIDFIEREAIDRSSKEGRKGLGAIHVFPVVQSGNDLANNEHTITVSAIGYNGTVPGDRVISSSVLTSGLRDGNNISAKSMVTASYGNKCVSSFNGVSAATAQVAGVIALALDARPSLTLADVQDLIVHSSDVSCLDRGENISSNAAGLKFHKVFGFGLINASKLVRMAKSHNTGITTSSVMARQISSCKPRTNYFLVELCYNCPQNYDNASTPAQCLNTVKTVKLKVMYETSSEYIKLILTSPSGTRSTLQDVNTEKVRTKSGARTQILTSVHFWDESGIGLWRLEIHSKGKFDVVGNVSLTFFGVISEQKFDNNLQQNCESICQSSIETDVSDSHDNSPVAMILGIVLPIVLLLLIGYSAIACRKRKCCNKTPVNREEDPVELASLHSNDDDD